MTLTDINSGPYHSPYTEAVLSQRCFPRTVEQDGCLAPFLRYERKTLATLYIAAFSLVGLQMILIAVALMCSNHVTNTFGKVRSCSSCRLAINSNLARHRG